MALFAQKGAVTCPASPGNQTLSLTANSDPEAIILWSTGQTADGLVNADGRLSIGLGTYRGAAVQQRYISGYTQDGAATSATARGNGSGAILKLFSTTTPTIVLEVDLVSMSTGPTSEVVLNFATTLSGAVVHYMILGGSDITDALVSNYTTTVAAATQDVTIASGFGQPDLLIMLTNSYSNEQDVGGASSTGDFYGMSFAKSATERWYSFFGDNQGTATMTCGAHQRAVAMQLYSSAIAIDSTADLSARANWPVDGFQLSYSDQAGGAGFVYYLALKGTFTSTIGNTTIPTAGAPQTQNLALASGSPVGAMFVQWPGPAQSAATIDTTDADNGGFMLGGTDGTNEGCAGMTQDDANTTAQTGVANSTAKAFQGVVADATLTNPPILQSECDASTAGSNLVLTWNDTDTIARAFGYVLLGSSVDSTAHYQSVPFMGGH